MPTQGRPTLTRRQLLPLLAGAILFPLVAACSREERGRPADSQIGDPNNQTDEAPTATPELGPSGHFRAIQVFGDGTRHLIPIEEIVDGGPGKDGIPSIDEPKFEGADQWAAIGYRDEGLVIGVEVNGRRRAYPFQVLVWHEIANDVFDGLPLLVTYCPLCGSGIVFRRELGSGEAPEFGVTGRLYNSDLLMYDRSTNSVWAQLTGTAVIGELTGERLEIYPSELMTWSDWKRAYPDSEVLSRETGFPRDYDRQPYGDYDQRGSISFPVAGEDDRLHRKARITGVEIGPDLYAAYPDDAVRASGPVNVVVGGVPLLVVADPSAGGNVVVFERLLAERELAFRAGEPLLVDEETGSSWNGDGLAVAGELAGAQLRPVPVTKAFWFAWFAFHQQTELWLPGHG